MIQADCNTTTAGVPRDDDMFNAEFGDSIGEYGYSVGVVDLDLTKERRE